MTNPNLSKLMRTFLYKQDTKYGVTHAENLELLAKYKLYPYSSIWTEQGCEENGSPKFIEKNWEIETFG